MLSIKFCWVEGRGLPQLHACHPTPGSAAPALDRHQVAELLEPAFAYAVDLAQLVDPNGAPVAGAPVDDVLGGQRPDAGSYAATRPFRFCMSDAWVDLTLQHKNLAEILVDGQEIIVRSVGARCT